MKAKVLLRRKMTQIACDLEESLFTAWVPHGHVF